MTPVEGVHPADAAVPVVGDVQVALAIRLQSKGLADLGRGGWAAVPAEAGGACPCVGGDDPRSGVHLADAVAVAFGDVQVALGIHVQAVGIVDLGLGGWAAIPAGAADARPRVGGDDPRHGVHLADAVVVLLADVQVARMIHLNIYRLPKAGLGGQVAIPSY